MRAKTDFLAPIAGEHGWAQILPSVRSYAHFSELVGDKVAAFVGDCFRAHLEGHGEGVATSRVFDTALKFVHSGEIEAFVLLDGDRPRARISHVPADEILGRLH